MRFGEFLYGKYDSAKRGIESRGEAGRSSGHDHIPLGYFGPPGRQALVHFPENGTGNMNGWAFPADQSSSENHGKARKHFYPDDPQTEQFFYLMIVSRISQFNGGHHLRDSASPGKGIQTDNKPPGR